MTEILDAVGVKVTPLSKGSKRDLEEYLEKKTNKDEALKELEESDWPQQLSKEGTEDEDDPLSIRANLTDRTKNTATDRASGSKKELNDDLINE